MRTRSSWADVEVDLRFVGEDSKLPCMREALPDNKVDSNAPLALARSAAMALGELDNSCFLLQLVFSVSSSFACLTAAMPEPTAGERDVSEDTSDLHILLEIKVGKKQDKKIQPVLTLVVCTVAWASLLSLI